MNCSDLFRFETCGEPAADAVLGGCYPKDFANETMAHMIIIAANT